MFGIYVNSVLLKSADSLYKTEFFEQLVGRRFLYLSHVVICMYVYKLHLDRLNLCTCFLIIKERMQAYTSINIEIIKLWNNLLLHHSVGETNYHYFQTFRWNQSPVNCHSQQYVLRAFKWTIRFVNWMPIKLNNE